MITARVHIGVDVGKDWLDVCYPDGKKEHIKNIKSCRTKLIAKAAKLGAIVSFEATVRAADAAGAVGVSSASATRCSPVTPGGIATTNPAAASACAPVRRKFSASACVSSARIRRRDLSGG